MDDIEESPTRNDKKDEKIERLQDHVEEVSNIMQMNIDKIMERGSNLDNLQDRSQNLSEYSTEFRNGARRVQRKMWWKNMKINIIIGIIVAIILIIIIGNFH
ncbi:synaptobrevin-like protein [Euroglyphus maynei]|uniref:Synaptobrevin-like protein n=1 Tax=Euroglyphus maynei TaxID=6958 RepID=A0A1Y3B045_EURMA|nr:synaptobrevin-like protein [Euroglyphus maynei]